MDERKLAVVALGGNAILDKKRGTDIHAQFQATRLSMEGVVELLKQEYKLLLTHGNGPQVGNIMLMVECSKTSLPETPLGVADAMTCGSIGYMIEQSLQNTMIRHGIWRNVVTIPAQVVVDRFDPALDEPTKPIGPFYSAEEAKKLEEEQGWVVRDDAGRGYRRYVASPYPLDIVEKESIRHLIDENYLVITGGGGGIPVYYQEDGTIEGMDCVIDKDLASMKLALSVGAHELIIITGVPQVSINFGTPQQQDLSRITLAQARHYQRQGHFPAGSMGPKIAAAIEFVQADPENRVIITDVESLPAAIRGEAGTVIQSHFTA
ncbi:carbamate kinase [Salinispira pacifica]|uniref:Carbamate kinase n=1 Tax=Salinispira pacifica TaxID=1307761 RepID=V5WF68_9SPIO|nr:carbamate kinase [Salinispira pacifica]AHC14442.1 Carbamate kinase [Salinispira pacifica]